VDPLGIVATALRTYREQFRRVAGTAFVVFGVVAAIDVMAAVLIADDHVARPLGAAITAASAAALAMAGVVFYAGVLDKIVGAHLHGHPDVPLRKMWRVLPLGRLAVADVLLAAGVLVGTALGLIPALLVFTFGALVGPVITIEDRKVFDAFRRSAELVRPCFWTTLFLVTLPVGLEQGVLHAIDYTAVFEHAVVPALILNGLLGAAVGSYVGLLEVVLAHDLIARSSRPRPAARPAPSRRPPASRDRPSGTTGRGSG